MRCLINSFDKAREFVIVANQCSGEIDVKQRHFIVDGKSIVGVMSLNLGQPVEVSCSDAKDELLLSEFADEERALEGKEM